jgi:hypothetical protein
LLAAFVPANQRVNSLVRTLVNRQDVFHRADKLGILWRRNTPFFSLPGF